MTDYKNLLTITPIHNTYKNIICVHVKWDANDADFIENTFWMDPENLFKNKKLIYCLAYISCNSDFKGYIMNCSRFNQYVPKK